MSKCPLQIYINDKYSESCPSERVSNEILKKSIIKRCSRQEELKQQESSDKPETILENDKHNTINNSEERCEETCSHSILDEYLQEHSESIEAYHNLQKQQEEVLKLCKIKLSKRYPSIVVKDEDIIKALRIAENSYTGFRSKSSDQITHVVLNIILSNQDQKAINAHNLNRNNNSDKKNVERRRRKNRCGPDISISEYFNTKGRKMLSRFLKFFTKPHSQKPYLASSDNYFNNSQYKANKNVVSLIRHPPIAEDANNLSGDDKVKEVKELIRNFGDASNTSASTIANGNRQTKKKTNLIAYYCTYQRDVDFLKSEIRRQKYEIRSIRKNLTQCLSILKTFDDKQQIKDKKMDFFKNNLQTFHVFTPSEFKGFDNPAEPYSRSYQQYKAETGHCTASCSSDTKDTTSNTSSSDNRGRSKCCSCTNKKSSKKRKRKKKKHKRSRSRSKTRSRSKSKHKVRRGRSTHRICTCPSSDLGIRSSPPLLYPPAPQVVPPSPSPPPVTYSEPITSPPPVTTPLSTWVPPPDCICQKLRQQAILDHIDFTEEPMGVQRKVATEESESTPTTESSEHKTKKKRRKQKLKKRKAKMKHTKSKQEFRPAEKPESGKRRGCIKFLKIMCCGSGCL